MKKMALAVLLTAIISLFGVGLICHMDHKETWSDKCEDLVTNTQEILERRDELF